MSSLQLRLYRIARRDGVPRIQAADLAGVGRREAAFTDADDAREPPAAEAFVLTPSMARLAIGALADLPLGAAAVERLSGRHHSGAMQHV